MKHNKTFLFILAIFFIGLYNYYSFYINYKKSIHKENLENSPIKKTYKLSKAERRKINLPPNQYQEKMWELSMNPMTGKPDIDDLFELQYEMNKSMNSSVRAFSVPGESE